MKKIVLTNLVALLSLLTPLNLLSQTAVAPSGDGTACDPYQISSLDNLYWMTQTSTSWASGKYFIQTANIDAAATSTWGSGAGFPAIGTFSANYDGRDYTISNILMNRTGGNRGVFGSLSGAKINNLNISNPSITFTSGANNAILAGELVNSTINNVDIIGGSFTYTGTLTVQAGFIGRVNSSVISSCSSTASVTSSTGVVGGFVGKISGATTFNYNYTNSSILFNGGSNLYNYRIAGFVGQTETTETVFFNNCYSLGSINSSGSEIGGFIGLAYGYINFNNCYSRTTINTNNVLSGGFFGNVWTPNASINYVVFSNCYATGSVANSSTGGFGSADHANISYNNCFWDNQTSGRSTGIGNSNRTGLTGKTTAEMKTQSTFTSANWDFINNVWGMSSLVNDNYPNLTFPTITLTPLVSGVNSGTVSANQVVCYNASPANIVLTGSCGSIQWQSSIDNSTWSNISGATAATLTAVQMGASLTTKYFRAVLTGNSNTAYSNVVTVKVNNGLAFDGTGDFVSLGNHSSLNFTGNFTIESWVKVPSVPKVSINTIFSKNYVNLGNPGYMLGFNSWNSSNLLLIFEPSTGSYASNRPLIAGQWNHVAAVVSSNGTFLTFYINGKPAGTTSITLSDASSVNEFIGSMDASGNYSLSGTLDELRIWNYALTESELQLNLDNPLVGNETGLVAYYDFNQGVPSGTNTGLTIKDQTANGINGTVNGISLTGSASNFVDGNHLSVISPETTACFGSTSPKIIFGGTGKTPSAFQWYSNTTAATSGATSIAGATLSYYNSPTTTAGTSYYYVNATGTCASSTTSNFAKVIVTGGITGNDYLYLGNTGNYTSTETAAAVNPWVISNTAFATTTNTGVLTAVAAGAPTLTFTSAAGCIINKTINVVPTTWKGTTSSDWNTGSNWNGLYVPTTVNNLIFDNAAGNDLTLDQNRTLTTLNFGTGVTTKKIILGNFNLTLPSVTSITNNSTVKYVKTNGTGKLSVSLADLSSAILPIGNSAYNSVVLTNKSGATDVFSARVVDAVYVNGVSGSTVTTPIVNRTWDISKTNANAGSGVDFQFSWNAGEVINGTLVTPKMNHHTGSNWEIPTVTSTTYGSNVLTVIGYTGTFSPFAISEGTSALPVELTSFNANCNENTTMINWQTASEHNSASFDVEKSRDGANWSVIKTVAAAGNSTTTIDYSVVDSEKSATIVYYRLNQIDQDGVSKIYGPISATCGGTNDFTAIVYPNPATEIVTVEMNSPIAQTVSIQICGTDGKAIVQMATSLEEGTTQIPLSIETLKAGVYTVQVNGENATNTIKLVVQ
ncbi:MAG: T9SS type A sorting domain-containing protein [Crocinitomicaceae bacterium]|nr:T9SS type A sorting domain-containing protein [Crocinitomicaceae bacterium]